MELAAETARLVERLTVAAAPRPVVRNLFQFAPKIVKPAADPAVRDAPVSPAPVAPAPPRIVLLGVAEDKPDGRRTAIVTLAGELFHVREGESIGGRFRLARVGSDAIELEDTIEFRTIRIALP
jgi:hypothetical protein